MKEQIEARQLATGDTVHFPRAGAKRAGRIVASNWLSVSFLFGGKLKTFQASDLLTVERANRRPEAEAGEVERLDTVTNRVSLLHPASLANFSDIRDALCTSNCAPASTIAMHELQRRSAVLFTPKAIYRMPAGPAANMFEYRRAA